MMGKPDLAASTRSAGLRVSPTSVVSCLAFAVAIATGVACTAADTSTQTTEVSARLKWLPGATYIGSIVAKQAGFWQEQGLNVTVFPGGFEADPIKLVAAGSNDFGITGADQLLQARANGVPIVAIFMELPKSPVGWMAMENSGIKAPEDMIGKKVGAAYGTNIEPTLDALLAKRRINPKSLIRIPVKYDLAPLYTGQVDVYPVYLNGQPIQARMEGKQVTTIDPTRYGVTMYGNVYFTTEKMVRERPAEVQRFVNGLAKGWSFALANPDSAVKLLIAAEPSLKPQLESAILQATIPFALSSEMDTLGLMTDEHWRETRDLMMNYAGLPKNTEYKPAYTNQFARVAGVSVRK